MASRAKPIKLRTVEAPESGLLMDAQRDGGRYSSASRTVQLCFSTTPDTQEALRREAYEQGRSQSKIMDEALTAYLRDKGHEL